MMMPILDQIVEAGPAAFQSVDPMAGMDIAEVKRRTCGKMALMGNVRCDHLQTGTHDQIRESARYCLEHGTPGGGYIFSSSNTIFNGVPLASYECMLDEYRQFCASIANRRRIR
jgi:uroporphyrinogen decarboxylase